MKRRDSLRFAIAAVLMTLTVGCNSILGIKDHKLAAGGSGGDTGAAGTGGTGTAGTGGSGAAGIGGTGTAGSSGSGGAAGTGGTPAGPACSVDGSVTDADGADAAVGTTCGFLMPNPVDAPGDLPNRASYKKNQALKLVTDNITGLTWEAEVDKTVYTQHDAIMHCANKGDGSWRLPTRIELMSLVDFTIAKPGPTISTAGFANDPVWTQPPDIPDYDYRKFWTSSPDATGSGMGWEVDFWDGSTHQRSSTTKFFKARCVTGTPCRCPPTRYKVQGNAPDELVHDAFTGLTWQRAVSNAKMTWIAAQTYCPAGWRLPTPGELATIVDETKESPANDREAFGDNVAYPLTPGEPFWTSAPQAGSVDGGTPAYAWYLTFFHGHSDVYLSNDPVNFSWWVRCVRWDGP